MIPLLLLLPLCWPCGQAMESTQTMLVLSPLLLPASAQAVKTPSASTSLSSSLLSLSPDVEGRSLSSAEADRDECMVKNIKQQEKMVMAKLDAHRCLVRDTVVELPTPNDIIVNFVQPSHVVVPRCTGLCLERPGCECQPKKKRHLKVDVIIGTNSSSTHQLCTSVEVEEHRGPCRCKCTVSNCHYNKAFDEDACVCRCKAEFGGVKAACAGDFEREWHEDTCTCRCRPRVCVSGHFQDRNTCQCRPVESTCAAVGSAGMGGGSLNKQFGHPSGAADMTHAPKYIGLACVVAIALAMLLSLYYLIARRRSGGHMHGIPVLTGGIGGAGGQGSSTETMVGTLQRAGGRATAAYTITINSASGGALDDAILPLTEDKTRF